MTPRPDAEQVKALMLSIVRQQGAFILDGDHVEDDLNLFAAGLVDSLGFVELIGELEQRLGIEIDLGELDPAHFGTVGPLSRYIVENCGKALRPPDGHDWNR